MIGQPHHVGCAVQRLQTGVATYSGALGLRRRSRAFDVVSQNVQVCFLEIQDGFFLELVAPLDEKARQSSFVRTGFYHLCFLVDDLEAAGQRLRKGSFQPLTAFASEAFDGSLCQFFLTPERHLLELAQISGARFRDFLEAHLAVDEEQQPLPGDTA